jgi:sugar lactone lactonase YvrE
MSADQSNHDDPENCTRRRRDDAGGPGGGEWNSNGTVAPVARSIQSPRGVAVDTAGTVYVADTGNNTIRQITAPAW